MSIPAYIIIHDPIISGISYNDLLTNDDIASLIHRNVTVELYDPFIRLQLIYSCLHNVWRSQTYLKFPLDLAIFGDDSAYRLS
jgi:hypothetical protein